MSEDAEVAGTGLERVRRAVTEPAMGDLESFLSDVEASADFDEVRADVALAIRNRHARATADGYDYWLGRLERWMVEPGSRFRFTDAAPVPLDALWPMTAQSETVIVAWLRDITKGPKDPQAYETWAEATGPLSPATLGLIISAIKARTAERQDAVWEPSTTMANVLRGLRRELRERYGSDRQAEPLLGRQHVALIAKHLAVRDGVDAARDRLLLELHAAGVDGGGISRLRVGSLRHPRRDVAAATHEANVALFRDMGDVGARSLVVPGRGRRGGNRDEEVVLTLDTNAHLARALDGYLAVRPEGGDDEPLIALAPSNPHHHIRSALGRLAELAGVIWRPARGAWATPEEVALMRAVCDRGLDWSGQLRSRRDLVMVLVGYLCALRRSELCALRIGDISFDGPKAVVTIRSSKTDQEGRGVKLAVRSVADAPAEVNTVALLRSWIGLLADEFDAGRNDPLFPSLNRHGDLARRGGQAVMRPIDPQSWSVRLRELAVAAQVFGDDDERYERVSGHSLRRGFVTSALLAGHDPVTVAKQTRHKNITMIATYADELALLEGTDWAKVHFGDQTMLGGEVGEG